ncbi:DNA ligase D [Phreatobacter sp.]|uniref:DNA ligase D n=1 Tax=Phreatobacter sp. TaxID=1966341 RepID=UPI0025F91D38|nr:DNA ligase D [Phreatobacter sp.]
MARARTAAKLGAYRSKRDFRTTLEPSGRIPPRRTKGTDGSFVVQKHAARRLHYDLRLEHDGVLWSWAVTRGPSLDPDDKRLAVHVEDHPLDYGSFEGNIPKGEYGAGAVIVWDRGRWIPDGDPKAGMSKGHLSFTLEGERLAGGWHLVRLKPRKGETRDNWLLIKANDDAASDRDILNNEPTSLVTGLTVEDVAAGKDPRKSVAGRKFRKSTTRALAQAGSAAPAFVPPCLASLAGRPPKGAGWVHEVKFDGYRVQAALSARQVRLLTRTGLDWTARFGRGIVGALEELSCDSAVIDGEIVVLDDSGISAFTDLQAALSDGRHEGMVYYAFDLLQLDGRDLTSEPLVARKDRLAHVLDGLKTGPLRLSEHFEDPGEVMLDHACRMGLEGVISKRLDAPYLSGRRGSWIKSKCTHAQEFVIVGYLPSNAGRDRIGSLVVAYHDDQSLQYAGRVGTGYRDNVARELKRRLDPLRRTRSPVSATSVQGRGVVWVEPMLAAEVEFRGWTGDGLVRQAAFKGLREDKPVAEIVREETETPPPQMRRRKNATPCQAVPSAVSASVSLSSPDKVLWPDVGLTKSGLLEHYQAVWHRMEPLVVRRPLSLVRAPDGIGEQTFFQKHASPGMGKAVRTLKAGKAGAALLYVEDFDGIASLVQMGVVEIHVWGSTIDNVECPDQVIFDLDPGPGVDLEGVRAGALEVRDRLKDIGLQSFVKLSGGKGYHVTVPLIPDAGWTEVKAFARGFADAMARAAPLRYTATLARNARRGKIFIDYLRNGRGATAVAPYSTRARDGAPIAAPVTWAEVEGGIAPNAVKVGAALPKSDPWREFRAAAERLGED